MADLYRVAAISKSYRLCHLLTTINLYSHISSSSIVDEVLRLEFEIIVAIAREKE